MRWWVASAVAVLALLVAGCGRAPKGGASGGSDLAHDMAAFDRAFIPAWALTAQERSPMAPSAMRLLTERWDAFQRRYGKTLARDADGQAAVARVSADLHAAQASVGAGNLPAAHASLDAVRLTLLHTRQRAQIGYYLDAFTLYQTTLTAMQRVTRGKTAETLTDDDLNLMARYLPIALSQWDDVTRLPFDSDQFGFSAARSKGLEEGVARETTALHSLREALDTRDHALVLHKASDVQTAFMSAYLLFGDFERVKQAHGGR
jgi:hypothetical protein